MKRSRIAIVLLGLIVLATAAIFFVLRSVSRGPSLTESQIAEAFSPAMNQEQISETLRRLDVMDYIHKTILQPGFWKVGDMPERRYSNYDGFAIDELSRTVSTITFDQAVGSDILSFSTRYLSGTFLLDSDGKLIAFRTRSYHEGL